MVNSIFTILRWLIFRHAFIGDVPKVLNPIAPVPTSSTSYADVIQITSAQKVNKMKGLSYPPKGWPPDAMNPCWIDVVTDYPDLTDFATNILQRVTKTGSGFRDIIPRLKSNVTPVPSTHPDSVLEIFGGVIANSGGWFSGSSEITGAVIMHAPFVMASYANGVVDQASYNHAQANLVPTYGNSPETYERAMPRIVVRVKNYNLSGGSGTDFVPLGNPMTSRMRAFSDRFVQDVITFFHMRTSRFPTSTGGFQNGAAFYSPLQREAYFNFVDSWANYIMYLVPYLLADPLHGLSFELGAFIGNDQVSMTIRMYISKLAIDSNFTPGALVPYGTVSSSDDYEIRFVCVAN